MTAHNSGEKKMMRAILGLALLVVINASATAGGTSPAATSGAAVAASAAAAAAANNAATQNQFQAGGGIFGADVLTGGELKIDWVDFSIEYEKGRDAIIVEGNDGHGTEPLKVYVDRRHMSSGHEILGVYWNFHAKDLMIFYRENPPPSQ